MANIKSFPNNSSEYIGAEWLMRWFHGRTSGVFGADSNCAVAPVQGSMAVTVTDGLGWLSNSDGDGIVWWNDYYKQNGSLLTLPIDIADGVLNRIDRVVVTWQTTNYVALPTIEILKGTNASTAVAPSITNNTQKRQISLAKIKVNAGATSISASDIIDDRMSDDCGIVTENVRADTSMIQAQYEEALAELQSAIALAWEGVIADGAITTAKIANNAVTAAKIASNSVSTTYTATIATTAWSGSSAPYTAEVAVTGITANDAPIIDLVASSTYATAEAEIEAYANVYRAVTGANAITFYATEIPSTALNVQIKCIRK